MKLTFGFIKGVGEELEAPGDDNDDEDKKRKLVLTLFHRAKPP